jgi:hypothetical protein
MYDRASAYLAMLDLTGGIAVHANLIAALVDDRRTFCLCGAVPSRLHQLCRSCFVRISQPSRSLDRHRVNRRARTWAWALATAASTLRKVGIRTRD